ncbi:YceI family protein [Flaviaesturariibacter aridisoli]|uniref:Polyisoprenoid-binding protein n=1 Tax=Flaviaesturariibacter aridisoli TaxID=2545761 RepID=A0A4V2WMI3_9BACT|nr:YceI family protein [Flaviaesturariibacter aridisoli]TCZ69652.1 polyisoprenoid-binding protein [Flaviaesturariibacter aridisoli]
MKKLFVAAALLLSTSGLFAQSTWNVDPVHSNVRFTVSHLVISEVEGSFKKFNGSLQSAKPDFTDAKINFSVDVNSINTDNEGRDKHLKGDDFFNAAQYPAMNFTGTSFRKVSGNQYELKGNLSIRNVTKPVVFKVTYGGTVKDPWGNIKAGFKASGTINRFDYGLKWNSLTEAGGAVVGNEIAIDLRLEFAQAK